MPKNSCIMQIWAEPEKSALPICNYSQILYQFLTFTQNLKRSPPDRSLFSTLTVTICTASPPASLMGLRMNHVLTYFCSQKAKHYPEWLQLFKNIWFCLRQNITLFPQQFAITWYTIIYCHTIFIS